MTNWKIIITILTITFSSNSFSALLVTDFFSYGDESIEIDYPGVYYDKNYADSWFVSNLSETAAEVNNDGFSHTDNYFYYANSRFHGSVGDGHDLHARTDIEISTTQLEKSILLQSTSQADAINRNNNDNHFASAYNWLEFSFSLTNNYILDGSVTLQHSYDEWLVSDVDSYDFYSFGLYKEYECGKSYLCSDNVLLFHNTTHPANFTSNNFEGIFLESGNYLLLTMAFVFADSPFDEANTSIAADLNLTPATVPVPAAVWLFGSGLIGLISVARRRKAA